MTLTQDLLSHQRSPQRDYTTTRKMIRRQHFWNTVATIVFAVLLAQWAWIFLAPKDASLPTTAAWKKTSGADRLFGDIPATGTSSSIDLGNIQLVGVFAHPTAGFAVLAVEGKQVGVGLGELVVPGARLVETKAEYVLIERGGVQSRVDLPASKPSTGIVNANIQPTGGASQSTSAAQAAQLSPQQRATMQKELEQFRRSP